MTYVKIFYALNFDDLETKINAYAERNNEEIVSVSSMGGMYTAVVFKERDKDDL